MTFDIGFKCRLEMMIISFKEKTNCDNVKKNLWRYELEINSVIKVKKKQT